MRGTYLASAAIARKAFAKTLFPFAMAPSSLSHNEIETNKKEEKIMRKASPMFIRVVTGIEISFFALTLVVMSAAAGALFQAVRMLP
jgi:hypothetical protein